MSKFENWCDFLVAITTQWNTIRCIVGFVVSEWLMCVCVRFVHKNLITVYTQWNPIMANENYFCVCGSFEGELIFPTRAPYVSQRLRSPEILFQHWKEYYTIIAIFVLIYAQNADKWINGCSATENPFRRRKKKNVICHADVFSWYFLKCMNDINSLESSPFFHITFQQIPKYWDVMPIF